jgi:hypothetical protein
MRDVVNTAAGTIAKCAVSEWEYAYIAEGREDQAQYQMKYACGRGRVNII